MALAAPSVLQMDDAAVAEAVFRQQSLHRLVVLMLPWAIIFRRPSSISSMMIPTSALVERLIVVSISLDSIKLVQLHGKAAPSFQRNSRDRCQP